MKSYTDLEQSKKLAKILPLETADYCWGIDDETLQYNNSPYPCAWKDYTCKEYYIPCWSLAALLEQLPYELCDDDIVRDYIAWLERQGNLMKALQISNAKIGELIEKNYYLKEQLEKQGNNMGISEATKQKLDDNLNKALEKETPESWNKFLDEQGEHKPVFEMKTPEESLGIDSDTYNKIVDECVYGEQKPTDKFHEGDWVVISTSDGEKVVQIDSIEYFKNGKPRYITSEGRWFSNGTEARLWNIAKEAKDGDVLVASDGSIFIFKGTINCACKHYIALATDGAIEINEGLKHYWETSRAVHPATKEQRDTLMKAMADAGYTFDFENKELKKTEPRQEELTEFEKAVKQVMKEAIECGDTHNLKADADMLLRLVQKPTWCEEDEEQLDRALYMMEQLDMTKSWDDVYNWLKSLKERYTWKPSYEQMKALNIAMCGVDDPLFSLYQNLKKLKG